MRTIGVDKMALSIFFLLISMPSLLFVFVPWITVSADNSKISSSVVDPDPLGSAPFGIRIHIKVICWIRNRINLEIRSQNVWRISLFEHFFKSLSLYLKARIWIRIRIHIKVKKSDPDPHQIKIRIRIRIRVTSRVRILINEMRIHNTDQ